MTEAKKTVKKTTATKTTKKAAPAKTAAKKAVVADVKLTNATYATGKRTANRWWNISVVLCCR